MVDFRINFVFYVVVTSLAVFACNKATNRKFKNVYCSVLSIRLDLKLVRFARVELIERLLLKR